MKLRRLNERQRRFVVAFIGWARGNATKAAIFAGYSERTARVQASQLLSKLNIQAAIEERGRRGDLKGIAHANERDVILTRIARNDHLPSAERIRAIVEMNKCEGRHITRRQLYRGITLEEALGASREIEGN